MEKFQDIDQSIRLIQLSRIIHTSTLLELYQIHNICGPKTFLRKGTIHDLELDMEWDKLSHMHVVEIEEATALDNGSLLIGVALKVMSEEDYQLMFHRHQSNEN